MAAIFQTLALCILSVIVFVKISPAFITSIGDPSKSLKSQSLSQSSSSSSSSPLFNNHVATTAHNYYQYYYHNNPYHRRDIFDAFLHPSNLAFLLLFVMLIASVSKTLHIIPYSQHARVDRFIYILGCGTLVVFLLHRLSESNQAGHVTLKRFVQYFFAGGICAFITHAICTPIDVVKTRLQTSPGRYSGMADAFFKIISEEGTKTLLKGLGATASGYFLHGAFKFSFYEIFKVLLTESPIRAVKPPLPIAALSGFLAECIACLLLCPMEAIRIRSVADPSFPSGVSSGLSLLLKTEGMHGLYKGLPAMLLKQVPYTVGQFVSFELSIGIVKALFLLIPGNQNGSLSAASISTIAGLMAGVTAAIISHPGDTILSKINQEEREGSAIAQIHHVVKTVGFPGLFIGIGPRLLQVSCMIGGQFLIYDSIKLWCGIMPASAMPTGGSTATHQQQQQTTVAYRANSAPHGAMSSNGSPVIRMETAKKPR